MINLIKQKDKEHYCLTLTKNNKKIDIAVTSIDSNHAQAQASDVCRALNADSFELSYKHIEESALAKLFKNLAFSEFSSKECSCWKGSCVNGVPCLYVFGERIYVKNLIIRYLDVPKDELTTKSVCKDKNCINPYHFSYVSGKNAKLSCGDTKLLLAYRSQGVAVTQIAEVLKVHRSTIYRQLKDERLYARPQGNRNSGNRG